jgi:hypothetical protein
LISIIAATGLPMLSRDDVRPVGGRPPGGHTEERMSAIAHLEYVVKKKTPGAWTICVGGAPCGDFGSRQDAVRAALGDADRIRRLGHDVKVKVARRDGSVRTVWAEDHLLAHFAAPGPRR